MSELFVVSPGLLTTVQDLGRWGFQAEGVSVAGPMDAYSHRLANALVGNPITAATLEITLVGPELEFDTETAIAIAGAGFDVTLDDQSVPPQTVFPVKAGTRLTFGRRSNGARAYLAIGGGVAVDPVLGSRVTHLTSRLGGLDGRALK